MAEELRFFLRTALYSAVIAAVYWFASYDTTIAGGYDWAGTAMLVATVLACGAAVAVMGIFARRALEGRSGSTLGVIGRWLLLTDPGGAADDEPLAAGLDPLPRASVWPIVAATAATIIAMGLVFGPWLTFPGIALLAWAAWNWVTQLERTG